MSALLQPVTHAPFSVAHERSTELGEAVGRLLKSAKDLLPLADGPRKHLRVELPGVVEALGRVSELVAPQRIA